MANTPRRLERSVEDRMIAGVASGVAHYFGIDTTLVRVLWALTVFIGGFGIVAYIVLWIVLPEAGTDHTVIGDMRKGKVEPPPPPEASPSSEGGEADSR